ncbi:MAG: hypothetical protein A2271_03690 [Candidatus Moranbacteria bacterium RIFOXYA12_FULL_35_19]|nr:MAG: hypothetical protein UR78_C0003G0010 [Candidatus Moranbacteria bacterium GW2011_GWF2_35_39]OGI31850.1 MAG: hypothetical protein A2343_01380 [Candidatus Moranbacteria bacterium RIFOXYB12_FULL_35_8]OGI33372.1 MAG: hypothetical protein A2489_03925 [Candidatus Moranbacteria bacterium RIFOXYC12_FULL_36_13]OGI36278.1 MAG: hypothetical protein A2271_03690 [Candidatus Moranbacteria bacterium RIFOXYA12_FULL_35_19]
MILEIKNISSSPANLLRRAGYIFQRQAGEEMSFVRPFSASGYPRFHMYVKVNGANMTISIHLDAKKETYGDDTRHHGEYENEGVLAEEVKRLKVILE